MFRNDSSMRKEIILYFKIAFIFIGEFKVHRKLSRQYREFP